MRLVQAAIRRLVHRPVAAPRRQMEAGMSGPLPLRPGVAAGGWLAVSGQVGLEDGALTDGVRAQTAQALANLRRVVESHGAGLIDVVKTNVFLVSMDDFAVMNEEYAKVFGEDRKSTRLNSSHANISYAVFCLKKKTHESRTPTAPHR